MKRLLITCLMILPSVPIVYGFLVDFGFRAASGSIVHTLVWWGMVAGWTLAVVLTAAVIMRPMFLLQPSGLLTISWILSIGLAGIVGYTPWFLFGLLFLVTAAASFIAMARSRTSGAPQRAFCITFAVCTWLGLGLTMLGEFPITGSSFPDTMWGYMTDWGDTFKWTKAFISNPGAGWWMQYLARIWPLALTTAWLAREYVRCKLALTPMSLEAADDRQ